MRRIVMIVAVFALVIGGAPGHSATKMDENLNAPDHSGCRHAVPSPRSGQRDTVLSETFDSGIPGDWTVIDNEGAGLVWTDLAGSGMPANNTNGTGDCAAVDSDGAGAVDFDTELWTPVIDLSNATGTALLFAAYYENYINRDYFDVDVSTDGGTVWTNVLSWNEDHGTEDVNIDLSAYDGMSSVIIRFRYYDLVANWDWYVQVDDVLVDATIAQQPTPTPEPVEAIPTLSRGNLIVMVLLLGLVAIVALRRR